MEKELVDFYNLLTLEFSSIQLIILERRKECEKD